jgi:glucose/arabinose dehydrogenase
MTDRLAAPRRRPTFVVGLAVLLLTLVGPVATTRAAAFELSLPLIRSGFAQLTQVTNAGDGTNRLFVVERRGTVRVVASDGSLVPGFFMDIQSIVQDAGGEQGLLGIAFHPNFEANRRLFAYYTRNGGDIVIARFQTNAAGTAVAAGSTGSALLVIEHSARTNHNGGAMAFSPEGLLYIGTGDGGGSGDPDRNGQSKTKNLLAKILRINVNGTGSGPYRRYSIPSTNPFRGSISGRDEVWAYGLRNPWRISFDRGTGMLFIADVGQSRYEEINREPAGYRGGRNYGWNVMEGKHCYARSTCNRSGKTLPVAEYTHSVGCSITGGHVYRGTDPANVTLRGWYVFADFCSGRFWTMAATGSSLIQRRDTDLNVTSFGEAENGELYVVTLDGRLFGVDVA